ncbi:MAG: PAS domain-containing protein [Proteobacteria bacterium]|nr:PAS domain-containing protein [Pseudomonadota bacterium]
MLENLIKALELANVEALVVQLPEAIITDVTPALLGSWSCQRNDLVGKPLLKAGAGTISARHVQSTNESGPKQIEVTFTHPLGAANRCVFHTQPCQEGNKQYYILLGRGVNAEQAEAGKRNEKRLNLALRSGGYALWDYDFDTNETYNSPEMQQIFGEKVGDAVLNFKTFNDLIHPEDRDKTLDEKIRKAPFGTDMFQTRYRVRTVSGSYTWVESLAGVVRDPVTGKPSKAIGLCRNIDDQMVALERLKNSEKNFRRTQAAAKLGSFSLRLDSNVSRLSAEMATLIGMADAMVHPTLPTFINMIEPGDRERFNEALEFAKLGRQIKNLEIAVKTKQGELAHFEVSIEPDRNEHGQIVSIFGCCQSVTERKSLERRFHQAQKMEAVGQLTGGIAHDFNNLLMVVMGNLQLVEQLVRNDERAGKRIRAAIEAAEKGSDLTRRMLAFSRQGTLQNKEVLVNDLVFSMEDMLKQALTAVVRLQIMPGSNVWPVKVDKTMLETAILNLAINARDAMKPKGGNLVIETSNRVLDNKYCTTHEDVAPGDYVEIAVTDTGCGIAPENIEKVFQPFFTTKAPEAGSGLGLSMIYGFVKQSNGHIKLYSEVGHGTTVKIYLPRLSEAAKDKGATGPVELQAHLRRELGSMPSLAAQPAMEARKPLVLVVEDNASVRDVAAAMIEEMGFEVLTASNGHEGLKAIEERKDIDLVLSDVIMAGGMNGPELASKGIKLRPDLKVLFMSGYAPGSVRQMQDLPDTIDLVNKPFTRSDLTEKVRKALAA